jgi:hypothetical protein
MPRGTPKTHFSGFSFTLLARRQSNDVRVINQVIHLSGLYDYVVYICLNGHTSLVCSARISEAKWHRYIAEHSEQRDE